MTHGRDVRGLPAPSGGGADPWASGAGRALRESLEAFASAPVTTDILQHALADAGYDAAPDRADELADFAEGPLRAEITAVLGAEVADAVIDGLTPILVMMRRDASSSGVVRKKKHSASDNEIVSVEIDAKPRREKSTPPRPSPRAEPRTPNEPARSSAPRHPAAVRELRPATVSQRGLPAAPRAIRIDVALASDDPELVSEAATRITNCRMAIIDDSSALPNARVVLLDTRRSLASLRNTWPAGGAPETLVLWPAGVRERQLVEVLQPNVRAIVCVGDEADAIDVLTLVAMHAGS